MARIIDAFAQFFDGDGNPLVNGWIKFNESGTNNTDKDTFADVNMTIANTNPLQLDGEGRCPSVFGDGAYNVVLYVDDDGSPGAQIQQFDPVGQVGAGNQFGDWDGLSNYAQGDIVIGDDGKYYRSIINNNTNNQPSITPTAWEEFALIGIWSQYQTYSEGDYVIDPLSPFVYESQSNNNINNIPSEDAGTNWIQLTGNSYSSVTVVPATDADITLSAAQYKADEIKLQTGSWTSTHAVNLPASKRIMVVKNQSGFNATIQVVGGAGLSCISYPGEDTYVRSDGADVFRLNLGVSIDKSHWPTIANNGVDATNDIDFSVGRIPDSNGAIVLDLTTAMTKQIDAAWASGTGAGGLASALSLSPSTTYHCFIVSDSDGNIDAGFDTSLSAANLLSDTGGSFYRRVASIMTTAGSAIRAFQQQGDSFIHKEQITDVDTTTPGTSAVTASVTVPNGATVRACLNVSLYDGSSPVRALITSTYQTDTAPSVTVHTLRVQNGTAVQVETERQTNTAQVRYRLDLGTVGRFLIFTTGWIDERIS